MDRSGIADSPDPRFVLEFWRKNVGSYKSNYTDAKRATNYIFRARLRHAYDLACGSSGRLLECAAGPGDITSRILQNGRFRSATVIDICPSMLAVARERIESEVSGVNVIYECQNIFDWLEERRDDGAKFDLILCLGLVAHTGRLHNLIQGLASQLTASGKILFQTTLMDNYVNRLVAYMVQDRYLRRNKYKFSWYYQSEVLGALVRSGLRESSHRKYGFGFNYLDKLSAPLMYQLENIFEPVGRRFGIEAVYSLCSSSIETDQ